MYVITCVTWNWKEEREKGMGQSMGKTECTGDRAKENKKGKGRKMEWGWERGK